MIGWQLSSSKSSTYHTLITPSIVTPSPSATLHCTIEGHDPIASVEALTGYPAAHPMVRLERVTEKKKWLRFVVGLISSKTFVLHSAKYISTVFFCGAWYIVYLFFRETAQTLRSPTKLVHEKQHIISELVRVAPKYLSSNQRISTFTWVSQHRDFCRARRPAGSYSA